MWSLAGLRVLRFGNPLVRLVLESRAHRLLSGRLLLLSYRGHRSGREYRIPLRYAETPDRRFVALALRPDGKAWWRSFTAPAHATLTVRGSRIRVSGELATRAGREEALDAYLARYRRSAHVAHGAAVVVFTAAGG
jgi:hypothetical protein